MVLDSVGCDASVDFVVMGNTGGANGLSQAELSSVLRALGNDAEDELDEYDGVGTRIGC